MTLNGSGLFAQAVSGLTNTYSILSAKSSGGISLSDITNPSSDINTSNLNASFQQYLINNFSTLDKDGDGKITSTDISNATQKMQSEGLTYAQLQQLCATNGDSTLLSTVLNHFSQIDKNGDGKVTEAEIKAFGYESDREEAWNKHMSFKGSKFSVFYGDDSAEDDTSSILDSRYPKTTESSGS